MAHKRTKQWKIFAVILGIVAALAVGALAFAGNFFFDYALNPNSRVTFMPPPSTEPLPAIDGMDSCFLESDGLRLHAYYAAAPDAHTYVIVCHGYSSQAAQMSGAAAHFLRNGHNVLLPDARAHGRSEGKYIGMGWPERRDIVAWAKLLIEQDPQAKIALYGISMGAATVMMASGEADLPENVRCVVEDCGYTSAWDEFAWQLNALYKLPAFPILHTSSLVTRLRAGYWFGETSAVEQVRLSQTPTLFIHGDQDAFVPFWMLDVVYEAATCEKQKLIIPGAGHAQAQEIDPATYWAAVDDFLATYFDKQVNS